MSLAIIGTLVGGFAIILGILGCVLPILPGPQLVYVGILLQHIMAKQPYSTSFLIIRGVIVVLVLVLDFLMPMLTSKSLGGTKYGSRWAGIGTFLGMLGGWVGILIGPFLGALLGEWWKIRDWKKSLNPAIGSFLGIFVSGILKLGISFVMAFYFIKISIRLFM